MSSESQNELSGAASSSPDAPSSSAATRSLERLNQSHMAMIELALQGLTRKQIAELTGRSEGGVGLILNDPLFQQELTRRREQSNRTTDQATGSVLAKAKQMIEDSSVDAVMVLKNNMKESDPSIRQRAADSLLDRVFAKKGAAQDGNGQLGAVIHVSGDALSNLVTALREDTARVSRKQVSSNVVEESDKSLGVPTDGHSAGQAA